MNDVSNPYDDRIKRAVGAPDIPHLYCNGLVTALSTGDFLLILEQNQQPVATINLSFTVAKTMASKLGNMVAHLENITGNTMLMTDEIEKAISSHDSAVSSKKDDEK